MDDSGALDPANSTQLTLAMIKKCMDKGMDCVSSSRVNNDTGWFIQNKEMFVLKQNIERNVFRL